MSSPLSVDLQRSSTIRHCGRAHVRGKIRRVWRNRYLELGDDGKIRYYELPNNSDCVTKETLVLKYILAIEQARILDVTTLRDIHVGLPRGSFGFTFRGRRLEQHEQRPHLHSLDLGSPKSLHVAASCMVATAVDNEPRDFLCAVSTLEEAQAWVVALQWAVAQYKSDDSLSATTSDDLDSWEIANHDEVPVSETKKAPKLETTKDSVETVKLGKIVLTKVNDFQIVLRSPFRWEVAYLVRVLVVSGNEASTWIIRCTADELQGLWMTLKQEGRLDHSLRPLQQLPRLAQSPSMKRLEQSLSIVDGLIRSLVLDASLVNGLVVRSFLGLQNESAGVRSCWWRYLGMHNLETVWDRENSIASPSAQVYAKRWLAKQTSKSGPWEKRTREFLVRNSPTWLLGGCGAALACGLPIARYWWQYGIPRFSIRLDVLLSTWMGAAYCGSKFLSHGGGTPQNNVRRRVAELPRKNKTTLVERKEDSRRETSVRVVSDNTEHDEDEDDDASEGLAASSEDEENEGLLSSPLPEYPSNNGVSCWSRPDCDFFVRGPTYLQDRVKIPSGPPPLKCLGVDFWLTDDPQRHIARHPSILGGKLHEAKQDVLLVNFLLPFGNFCAYFSVPDLSVFPPKLRDSWQGFLDGDQSYRDARLKLLPIVIEGPWIVKAAVGPGKSPALLGKVIPLQYYFTKPTAERKGVYEIDIIITASTIAKGILSVVKGHTKAVTIGFAFIIESASQEELPENVLCSFQIHSIHIEDCPRLPERNLDDTYED